MADVLVAGLLNWPFLLFVTVVIVLILFRHSLQDAVRQGGVTVEFGDTKLSVGDAVQEIDQELKQTVDDFKSSMDFIHSIEAEVAGLRTAVAALQTNASQPVTVASEPTSYGLQQEPEAGRRALRRVIEQALQRNRYRWRSTERLSIVAGVSLEEVREILRTDDRFVVSRGKSGREIAGLRERVR